MDTALFFMLPTVFCFALVIYLVASVCGAGETAIEAAGAVPRGSSEQRDESGQIIRGQPIYCPFERRQRIAYFEACDSFLHCAVLPQKNMELH